MVGLFLPELGGHDALQSAIGDMAARGREGCRSVAQLETADERDRRGATVATVAVAGRAWTFTALDRAMLGLVVLLLGLDAVSAVLHAGWITAAFTDLVGAGYLLVVAAHAPWRPLLARLALFGLVVGALELATDAAGERFAHSLIYPAGGPVLWASPAYMPLSWLIVITHVGYLAWRLRGLVRVPLAALLCALWAGLNIPFSEEMAYHARWWRYAPAPSLGHTPLYVMLFEALIGASLPFLLAGVERKAWRVVAWLGVVEGAWIPAAALLSWLVLGR